MVRTRRSKRDGYAFGVSASSETNAFDQLSPLTSSLSAECCLHRSAETVATGPAFANWDAHLANYYSQLQFPLFSWQFDPGRGHITQKLETALFTLSLRKR